jgi:hypothetical protein
LGINGMSAVSLQVTTVAIAGLAKSTNSIDKIKPESESLLEHSIRDFIDIGDLSPDRSAREVCVVENELI